MQEYLSETKKPVGRFMHTAEQVMAEMSGVLHDAAGDVRPGDSIQTLIARAARALGIECGRAKRLWYGEVKIIPAHEADNLRAWHRQHIARRADRLNAELAALQAQLATMNDGGAA